MAGSEVREGVILRGVGGLYAVFDGETTHECKARGRFRKEGITPLVGDRVSFSPEETGEKETYGYLLEILPRACSLIRPPLANVDWVVVVVAAESPEPDLLLVDKLLAIALESGIGASICVNKTDLRAADEIAREYESAGFAVDQVSANTGWGMEALRERLRGHIAAMAGQSGVGKSSLINRLFPDMGLKTGSVSRIERGRHTTRHCELLRLPDGGLLADTPGFSLLESEVADPAQLRFSYPEFAPYEGRCRFDSCTHRAEPGCAVREASLRGEVAEGRLTRYADIFAERKERWDRRYD